jgi:hypothetical protein
MSDWRTIVVGFGRGLSPDAPATAEDTVHPASVLLVTLDSCRYDTFQAAATPCLDRVAPVHQAKAPGHFTYASHAAMFVGFLPSLPGAAQPILDSKFARLFRLDNAAFSGRRPAGFSLAGRSIVDGFRRAGYRTIGTGAVRWFDPSTECGLELTRDFFAFYYPGTTWQIRDQIKWLTQRLTPDVPVFAFLNVGETHVPYYFDGAPWRPDDNPCLPFQTADRSGDCRDRQRACLEHADTLLGPLLARFAPATIVVCADHGDCWGEDGLWEHGVSHAMTLTVPLLVRFRGQPVQRTRMTSDEPNRAGHETSCR